VTPTRVPLFWVSLAFATGCLLGLDDVATWPTALGLTAAVMIAWACTRRKLPSLAVLYLAIVAAALAHTLILASAVAPDDIRRLPAEKAMASTQWRGLVTEDPHAAPQRNRRALDRTSFKVELQAWRPTGGQLFDENVTAPWSTASGLMTCTVLGPAQDIHAGDEIEFAAALDPIPRALIPGQLDLRSYDAARNIHAEGTVEAMDWRRLARHGPWLQQFSFAARDWAYDRLRWGIEDDPRTADFLAGMLIGYRQEIPADIEQDFRVTGTLHVFAISGQNIAEVVVVAIILLQLVGLVRWRWAWVIAPLVLIYCLLTGEPSSAVRATVMALAVLAAWRLGRPLNALGCWSIAALAMMMWDPRVLLDPGAQLSFGVVLGLILLSPPIYRWLDAGFRHDPFLPRRLLTAGQKREEKCWAFFAGLLAASIAATLVSEPLTALDFHQVTPISVVANLLVVPLAGFITIVGTVSVVLSLLSHALAAQSNNANWLLARIMIAIVHFFAHEPGSAINVADLRVAGQPAPFFVVAPLPNSACLLVKNGSTAWLIDTGRETPIPAPPARLLQFYGINRLDALILAQPDTPDNGAALAVAAQFRPRRIAVPALLGKSPFRRDLPEIAQESGLAIEHWPQGKSFDLGPGLKADVLGPAPGSPATRENDRALVLLFHAAAGAILDADRLDAEGQAELLRNHPALHADVLILGADAAPGADFLRALGVRFWLQTPLRQRGLNTVTIGEQESPPCAVWSLVQTGAVTVHFTKSGVELTPWAALPTATP
jgi:ComEC/Rec2-related protein